VNIKILVCQITGPVSAGSAGPVPTPVPRDHIKNFFTARRYASTIYATALFCLSVRVCTPPFLRLDYSSHQLRTIDWNSALSATVARPIYLLDFAV